jgi:transcriptional regulator with XRE-family HTH domain
MAPRDEPFAAQLRRVREARGISRSTLSRRTTSVGDMGISNDTITRLELDDARRPEDRTILLLGDALEATDEEFPAYGLAKARSQFDEHAQGFSAAWKNLERWKRC